MGNEALTSVVATRNANVQYKKAEHVQALKLIVIGDELTKLKTDNLFRQYKDKNGNQYKYWSLFLAGVFKYDATYANQMMKLAAQWHRLHDLGLTTSEQPKSTLIATAHLNDEELTDAWTRCTSGDKTQFVYYNEFRKYANLHQSVAERDDRHCQSTIVLKDDEIANLVTGINKVVDNNNMTKKKPDPTYEWDDEHRLVIASDNTTYTVRDWLRHIIEYLLKIK